MGARLQSTYAPYKGSVAWKVIEFLTTNPEEALSAEDVSVKFDTHAKNVHTMLGQAVVTGALTRSEDLTSGELLYRLGAGVSSIPPAPGGHPTLAVLGAALTVPTGRLREALDTVAIQIDKGIPLASKSTTRSTDWAALLKRMEPGDSCALPLRVRSSLSKIINIERGRSTARYEVRKVTQDTLRLWRTA